MGDARVKDVKHAVVCGAGVAANVHRILHGKHDAVLIGAQSVVDYMLLPNLPVLVSYIAVKLP